MFNTLSCKQANIHCIDIRNMSLWVEFSGVEYGIAIMKHNVKKETCLYQQAQLEKARYLLHYHLREVFMGHN